MADNGNEGKEEKATEEKPVVKEDSINLKVKDQDNAEVHFKVKKTIKFDKVFTAFCAKRGTDKASTRFTFDGTRLNGEMTPADLDMEDDDVIEAFLEQGMLRGFDQTTNLILEDCHERVYSTQSGVEMLELGLYVIRGDNVAVIGEVDDDSDSQIDFNTVRAPPLKAITH